MESENQNQNPTSQWLGSLTKERPNQNETEDSVSPKKKNTARGKVKICFKETHEGMSYKSKNRFDVLSNGENEESTSGTTYEDLNLPAAQGMTCSRKFESCWTRRSMQRNAESRKCARVPVEPGKADDPEAKEKGDKKGIGKVIAILTKAKENSVGACGKNTAQSSPTWRRVSIAVDSGACDSVLNPDDVPEHEVRESPESRRGENFYSATAEPIPNLGDIHLPMYTREGSMRGMTFRAAEVAKPLGAVKKICAAGHFVGFDETGSFILNKSSGEINWLREDDGNYMLDVWVPPPNAPSENAQPGFRRQA